MKSQVCEICESDKFVFFTKQYKKIGNNKETVDDRALYQCSVCGTISELPLEKKDFLDDGCRYYDQMRLSLEDEDGLMSHIRYAQIPKYKIILKEVIEKKFNSYKKWLDVGSCGFATTFLEYDFMTIEPDAKMVSLGKNLFDSDKIICSDLLSFITGERFNAILFNHSFYCVARLNETIQKIESLLEKDGIVLIGIGNVLMESIFSSDGKINSIDDIFVGETCKHYMSIYGIEYLFSKYGFELIENFLLHHNVPHKGNQTRYLAFKQKNINKKEYLKEKSFNSIVQILDRYKQNFFFTAKKVMENFNTKDTIFIGDKRLVLEIHSEFGLNKIYGFISNERFYANINNLNFFDMDIVNNSEIKRIVILDFKNTPKILEELKDKKIYQEIYYIDKNQAQNSLYRDIKSEQFLNSSFEFKLFETYYAKVFKQMNHLVEKGEFCIFGTAKAGGMAYTVCKHIGFTPKCFIDDNKTGTYEDTKIPIVSREIFKKDFLKNVCLMLKGPEQKGLDVPQLYGINIEEIISQ